MTWDFSNESPLDSVSAHEIIRGFLPLFRKLNDEGVDYCVVGGLAVLLHSLAAGKDKVRVTYDADIMFSDEYTNTLFSRDYLDAFATDEAQRSAIADAIFAGGSPDDFLIGDDNVVNALFKGARKEIDGVETPDVDVVRHLNNKSLADLHKGMVLFEGTPIPVASLDDLLDMKQQTIDSLLSRGHELGRPQDYIDRSRLEELIDEAVRENGGPLQIPGMLREDDAR